MEPTVSLPFESHIRFKVSLTQGSSNAVAMSRGLTTASASSFSPSLVETTSIMSSRVLKFVVAPSDYALTESRLGIALKR